MNHSLLTCYKCIVPSCKNTTTNSRHKVFVNVREPVRRRWCKILKLEYNPSRRMLCCEDHLNESEMDQKLHDELPGLEPEATNLQSALLEPKAEIDQDELSSSVELINSEVEACRLCLVTDVKMYNVRGTDLGRYLDVMSDITCTRRSTCEVLPQYICYQCAPSLKKFMKFLKNTETAQTTLLDIYSNNGQITKKLIQEQNRSQLKLQSSLDSYLLINYFYIKYDDDTNTSQFIKTEPKHKVEKEEKIETNSICDDNEINDILSKIVDDDDDDDDDSSTTDSVEEIKVNNPVIEIPSDDEPADFISIIPHRVHVERRRGKGLVSHQFQVNGPPKSKKLKRLEKRERKKRIMMEYGLAQVDRNVENHFNVVDIPFQSRKRKFSCKYCPSTFDNMKSAREHRFSGCVEPEDAKPDQLIWLDCTGDH